MSNREPCCVWDDSKPDIESVNEALIRIDQEAQKIIKGSAGGSIHHNGSFPKRFIGRAFCIRRIHETNLENLDII